MYIFVNQLMTKFLNFTSETHYHALIFLVSGDFCRLLIIFPNSLDPDQDRQNVGPDLDPNCFTL